MRLASTRGTRNPCEKKQKAFKNIGAKNLPMNHAFFSLLHQTQHPFKDPVKRSLFLTTSAPQRSNTPIREQSSLNKN